MENINKASTNKLSRIINFGFEKVLPIVLVIILIFRLLSHGRTESGAIKIIQFVKLSSSPLPPAQTIITLISMWFLTTTTLTVAMRPHYDLKLVNLIVRFLAIPVYVLNLIMGQATILLMTGVENHLWYTLALYLECVVGLIISLYYFIKELKESIKATTLLKALGIFGLLLIPALPTFFVQFVFGLMPGARTPIDLNFYHRLLIYLAIIIPVILYFVFRDKPQNVIRFMLIYTSCAVLCGFIVNYNLQSITEPWAWPFHLCNTALFIIPLCLIFRLKRLFYFTYFINIIGALFAMMMPNYDDNANLLAAEMFRFWYNHWIAFFMPLLIVALKEFKKPGLKEFGYSLIAFAGYFLLALFMNVYFTSIGHSVDYFFLNKVDTVADKLGQLGKKIFDVNWTIHVGELTWEFHPLYQVLFFIVYVGLELVEWFIYGEFFRISKSHYDLHMKLKIKRTSHAAYREHLSEEMKQEMMNNEFETKLVLNHFSKKYGMNKHYSVEDANLEVHGGEIFGFLGPNGAGKSTIIKSVVGIQPITEGSIEVCGYDVANAPRQAKANIGYVPDHYALYEKLTGREYINYIADIFEVSKEDRDERLQKYIEIFQLEQAIDNKIGTYSHGMKQKITIMSALIHNPKVWILDEPLTGLDPNSIYQVKKCMKLHAEAGNIVFFSSHLIDIVEKLCQRIAIIKKGHILCVENVADIEATGTTLEEFYMEKIGELDEEERGAN